MKKWVFIKQATWLLAIVACLFFSYSCDSQKRVARNLQRLEEKDASKKTVRSWPNNYTFQEYSEKLDEYKVKQAFYKKRKTQARIAGDKKSVAVLNDNIKNYQKKIDRLEGDKEYFKIYSLRDKEVRLKVREQERTQKQIERKKEKIDQRRLRENKAKLKEIKAKNKEREKIMMARRQKLEERKKAAEERYEAHLKEIDNKRKELATLQRKKNKASAEEVDYYHDEIMSVLSEIKALEQRTGTYEMPLDSIEIEIHQEEMIEESDTINVNPIIEE